MSDIIYPGSELPGNELRDYFSCIGGKTEGGGNLAGLCEPAVDSLIDTIIKAQDRDTLFTATRALDRLLLRSWIMIPQWYSSNFNIALWNRFGRPTQPIRSGFVMDDWWIDPALAAKTDAAKRGGN
jgi:microcin C transport system substrate-binding protein